MRNKIRHKQKITSGMHKIARYRPVDKIRSSRVSLCVFYIESSRNRFSVMFQIKSTSSVVADRKSECLATWNYVIFS